MYADIQSGISLLANIVEILVGGIAIYVAWTQRNKISAAFSILFSYSLQASLADLHHWLEELHENNINGKDDSKKVRIALAHIYGKIHGNPTLRKHIDDKLLKRVKIMMEELDSDKTVTETSRITICSEIKESLASLGIQNHTLTSGKI